MKINTVQKGVKMETADVRDENESFTHKFPRHFFAFLRTAPVRYKQHEYIFTKKLYRKRTKNVCKKLQSHLFVVKTGPGLKTAWFVEKDFGIL